MNIYILYIPLDFRASRYLLGMMKVFLHRWVKILVDVNTPRHPILSQVNVLIGCFNRHVIIG